MIFNFLQDGYLALVVQFSNTKVWWTGLIKMHPGGGGGVSRGGGGGVGGGVSRDNLSFFL